ncbi:MAG: hypothetical protein NTX50_05500 [Candidatus Sumerlaeota bacterium]|nr:hypothetical protein [Candidatus Sumerlaeota bacterium]
MSTADLIFMTVKQLPQDRQAEVLDFAEFIHGRAASADNNDDASWKAFSLSSAMRGMENDDMPEYSEKDIKESYQ